MGTLIDDLLSRVVEVATNDSLRIKSISKGFRFTSTMLENDACGICFSIFNQDPIESCQYIKTTRSMNDLSIQKLLQFAKNLDNDLERIIGISTLNAISQHILKKDADKYQFIFDKDPIDLIKFEETDRVVMIGNIKGFLPKIQKLVKNVSVIDERFENVDLPYLKSPKTTQEHLRGADIVFITGSAIVNNTLEDLLNWSEKAKEITVVGPTAGFIAEPLFGRGVTLLSSMQVLEPTKVLQTIAEGGGTPHFKIYCRKYNLLR